MPATTESLSREYCAEEVCDEGLHDQWSEDQIERFLPLHSGTVSRLVLNKESLQRSGPWHLLKFHILASEQVPKAPACKAVWPDRTTPSPQEPAICNKVSSCCHCPLKAYNCFRDFLQKSSLLAAPPSAPAFSLCPSLYLCHSH